MKTINVTTRKSVKYNKSNIFKRAYKYLNAIPMDSRTDSTWSECLRKSWHVEKNGSDVITFDQVYNKFYKEIVNYIKTKVKNVNDAEELAANVFIKLHRHFDSYDVYKAKIRTWIYTIANNIIIDHYRTDKAYRNVNVDNFVDSEGRETFQFVAPSSYETETVLDSMDMRERINRAFNGLKSNYKVIAELYFLEDRQYNEIAETLDVPIGTVKGMINRCRGMLQKELEGVYGVKTSSLE